jgi:hypothetical protein
LADKGKPDGVNMSDDRAEADVAAMHRVAANLTSTTPTTPPMYPPQSATTRTGGVRPGGVRPGTAPLPVTRPRRDTGHQRLLDEELWQVDHVDHEPDHRAGRRGGAV